EGFPGLPLRLALQLLDRDCAPLAGAQLELWHTRNSGLYSEGPIDFCTLGDADAAAATYFRGAQVADAEGKLAFDTCFPGWYPGRAIHIHFQVFLAGATVATRVSQLFFDAPLIAEIFAEHPDYAPFGQPDTPNAADGIFRGVGAASVLQTQRMSDGAMLASKTIQVV
ncbi:MAG: protocatechuate 3,4-dioxygenase, partial [Myxococcota bacterium]